jgi:oligopeptide transport system substrate-binding protein
VKPRWRTLGAVLLGLPLLLSGCGRDAVGPADFTFANGAEPETLDPHVITGQPDIRICEALFEGLTGRDAHGAIRPGLAQSWDISKDGRVYTFHLRDSVWSNGDPLTSQDFIDSWKRALDPVTGAGYVDFYYYIVNGRAFNEGKTRDFSEVGVKALDPRTLQVTLEYPTPFFLDLCACSILSPIHLESIKKWGEDWIKPGKLVSNGPYLLAGWRINDRIALKKNPRYWNAAAVHFDRIDALALSSATTAFNLFHSGQIGLILDKALVPTFFLDTLKTQPYFHASTILATYFYRFNVTRKPFDDPRVRQAFALASDKARIVERITRAGEEPAGSFTPPGMKQQDGYEPPAGLGYDVAKARALLAAAGYPGGKGFPPVSILYNGSEQNKQIATEMQAIWEENLGVHVSLAPKEWKVYLNAMTGLDFDIARSSWVADYPDPNTFLDCFVTGRGNNRTGFSDPAYDGLLERARQESDPARRLDLLRQAETILVEKQLPILPLYHYVSIAIYNPAKLAGFYPSPIDEHQLWELYRPEPGAKAEAKP